MISVYRLVYSFWCSFKIFSQQHPPSYSILSQLKHSWLSLYLTLWVFNGLSYLAAQLFASQRFDVPHPKYFRPYFTRLNQGIGNAFEICQAQEGKTLISYISTSLSTTPACPQSLVRRSSVVSGYCLQLNFEKNCIAVTSALKIIKHIQYST